MSLHISLYKSEIVIKGIQLGIACPFKDFQLYPESLIGVVRIGVLKINVREKRYIVDMPVLIPYPVPGLFIEKVFQIRIVVPLIIKRNESTRIDKLIHIR